MCWFPEMPKEGVTSPGAGVTVVLSCLKWVLGTDRGSRRREAKAFNEGAISPAHQIFPCILKEIEL